MPLVCFFFKYYGVHRDCHVLPPSFPTRRSSDRYERAASVTSRLSLRRHHQAHVQPTERGRGQRHQGSFGGHEVGRHQPHALARRVRSEEHTSELQSLMRISYAVFCLKHTTQQTTTLINSVHTLYTICSSQ